MALRRTLCTQCDGVLEIAEEAKSVACRHCGSRVVTEALDLAEYVAVRRIATANHLLIKKKALVYASVRADVLEVDGLLQGDAVGLARITLGKHARIKGSLRAAMLVIEPGASISGDVKIGLEFVPELEILRKHAEAQEAAEAERVERERAEKAAREKAEREAKAEKAAKEKAEREAKEKAEKEAKAQKSAKPAAKTPAAKAKGPAPRAK